MKAEKRDYFVYHGLTEELYASNLTLQEADDARLEFDRLIEKGCCSDGCACCGCLSNEDDGYVAKRLGLI